jgi:hypothetical protein
MASGRLVGLFNVNELTISRRLESEGESRLKLGDVRLDVCHRLEAVSLERW